MFGVERIEPGVAGTAIGPKSIQWVQLRDRQTGAAFFAANHHLVPSIDDRGRPDPRSPKRVRLARLQLDAAAALADRLGRTGPVLIGADWNIDARRRRPGQGSTLADTWRSASMGSRPTGGCSAIRAAAAPMGAGLG